MTAARLNKCVFCGATGTLTREHIFAKWVKDLYPEERMSTGVIIKPDGSKKVYTQALFGQTVRVVCKSCNDSWMSALEAKVAPVLGPMVKSGVTVRLGFETQRLIATWAVKTGFMFQYIHPSDRVIPDSEYHRLYATKQPPKSCVVWLAQRVLITDHTGGELIAESREEAITQIGADDEALAKEAQQHFAAGRQLYRVTFMLGRLVIQIFGHDFPGGFRLGFTPAGASVRQWIWPAKEYVTWPPNVPIEAVGGLYGLHATLQPPPVT